MDEITKRDLEGFSESRIVECLGGRRAARLDRCINDLWYAVDMSPYPMFQTREVVLFCLMRLEQAIAGATGERQQVLLEAYDMMLDQIERCAGQFRPVI